jgi:hypothetical protein
MVICYVLICTVMTAKISRRSQQTLINVQMSFPPFHKHAKSI